MKKINKADMAKIEKLVNNINNNEYCKLLKEMSPDDLFSHIERVKVKAHNQYRNPFKSVFLDTKFQLDAIFNNQGYRIPWQYLRCIETDERENIKLFLKFIYDFKSSYFEMKNSIDKKIDKFIKETQNRRIDYVYNSMLGKRNYSADAYIEKWNITFISVHKIKVLISNYYFFLTLKELLIKDEFKWIKEIIQKMGYDFQSKFFNFFRFHKKDLNNVLHKKVSRTANDNTDTIQISNEIKEALSKNISQVDGFLKLIKNLFSIKDISEEQTNKILNLIFANNLSSYFKFEVVPAIYNSISLEDDITKHKQLITYDLISSFVNPFNEFPTNDDFKSATFRHYSKPQIENLKIQRIKRIIK